MAINIQHHAQKRLQTERRRILSDGQEIGFFATPKSEKDILHWHVFIKGSLESVFENSILRAEMSFPIDYPMNPPSLKFITPMFHPNVYKDGNVCISILHKAGDDPTAYESSSERWSPVQSIRTIILSILVILNEPNKESPADVDACKKMSENEEEYKRIVREMAQKNSIKIEDLIKICGNLSEEEKAMIERSLYKNEIEE